MNAIRVGDAERAQAVAQLQQHAAAGRLGSDELRQRTAAAETAVYDNDLDELFRDLPGGRSTQEFHWAQMPNGPSGVSDEPPSPQAGQPTYTGPVVTGEVLGAAEGLRRRRELTRRDVKAWQVVTPIVGIVAFVVLANYLHFWPAFFLWFFIFPALGGWGRRRR